MRINAEFVISVAQINQLPKERLPEIGLVGRSNVGKSSLINTLVGNPRLARTSNTPGRTQTLNYYRITPEGKSPFYLVDMPGYGYAAINKGVRGEWEELIGRYATTREQLCGIIQLIDLRHPPQPLDHDVSQWLQEHDQNVLVVGTKADKIARTKVPEAMLQVAEKLNIDSRDTLAFSAQTGLNKEQLWGWILEAVDNARRE